MKYITILISFLLFSSVSFATGIPTFDAGNVATTIAENIKTLQQLQQQLDALNSQIAQAKRFAQDTKNRFEGNMQLSDLFNNDQFLNSLPKDAKDILTNGMSIAGLRDKYGLKTENSSLQKNFDNLMAFTERTERNYKNTLNRLNNLKQLKVLADVADTPTKKADIANKLALMQLEFSQEQAAIVQSEIEFKAQRTIEVKTENEAFRQSLRDGARSYKNKHNR